jgi:hypothetical protein
LQSELGMCPTFPKQCACTVHECRPPLPPQTIAGCPRPMKFVEIVCARELDISATCDEQTHPHRPRLVVSHSTCPPLSSSPHANRFVIGPAVIKTHTHRDTYRRNRRVAFLPACMSTLGRITRRALALDFLHIQQNRQKIILRPLVISRTARSFVTVVASSSSKTWAPSGWSVLRLWLCVVPPPPRVATSLPLAARRPSTWPTKIMAGMSATSTASLRPYS